MSTMQDIDILLVEDNPIYVELMLRALKEHNITNNVCIVNDGTDALDAIFARNKYSGRSAANFPKVVLLDLKLLKMDGLEVLRTIKRDDKAKVIPVVVLTTSTEDRHVSQAYRLGANSYIVKAVDFDKFVEEMGRMCYYWLQINHSPQG